MTDPTATECRATLTRSYERATRAQQVANAVRPDNTASMTTQVEGPTLTTEIRRDSTGGVQSTVDDFVVNLGVAEAVLSAIETASEDANKATDGGRGEDDDGGADIDNDGGDGIGGDDGADIETARTAAEPTTDETTNL